MDGPPGDPVGAVRTADVRAVDGTIVAVGDLGRTKDDEHVLDARGLVAVPEVASAISLDRLLDSWDELAPGRRIIFCDEAAEPGGALATLEAAAPAGPLAVLIGPEGGFSPRERERLLAREDTIALSLGPRIMRADTAAIAALGAVQLVLGDWRHV